MSWLSDKGWLVSPCSMSFWMSAQTAVLDAAPPLSVATWLPKKYFSSKVPNGVRMYFWLVAREMVDSWRPTTSAMSRRTKGRSASGP